MVPSKEGMRFDPASFRHRNPGLGWGFWHAIDFNGFLFYAYLFQQYLKVTVPIHKQEEAKMNAVVVQQDPVAMFLLVGVLRELGINHLSEVRSFQYPQKVTAKALKSDMAFISAPGVRGQESTEDLVIKIQAKNPKAKIYVMSSKNTPMVKRFKRFGCIPFIVDRYWLNQMREVLGMEPGL